MPKMDYATKNDLEEAVSEVKKEVKKIVLNSEVKILGELQKMREDDAAHRFSHLRMDEDIEDHEKRISKLEAVKV